MWENIDCPCIYFKGGLMLGMELQDLIKKIFKSTTLEQFWLLAPDRQFKVLPDMESINCLYNKEKKESLKCCPCQHSPEETIFLIKHWDSSQCFIYLDKCSSRHKNTFLIKLKNTVIMLYLSCFYFSSKFCFSIIPNIFNFLCAWDRMWN